MLTNLFSIFDTNLYIIRPFFVILSCALIIILFNYSNWAKIFNRKNSSFRAVSTLLTGQFKASTTGIQNTSKNIKNLTATKLAVILIILVLILNFYSLFPFILSVTSHISLNLTFTLAMWRTRVCLALMRNIKAFLSHLTPRGTPIALISFIVLIETVRNIIRPLTLAVRLMANIVAGHLLLTLLSKFSLICSSFTIYSSAPIIILGVLEIGVSFIQAYVITLLCTLYLKEAFH